MDEKTCKDCQHYFQHYVLRNKNLIRTYCGHCALGHRIKRKRPDMAACESFVPAPPDEDAFASKEYLSKELLQYMLELELLPQIEDSMEKTF